MEANTESAAKLNTTLPLCFELTPHNHKRMILLCGENDRNLRWIEENTGVQIKYRSHRFSIEGEKSPIAKKLIEDVYHDTHISHINTDLLHLHLFEHVKSKKKRTHNIIKPRSEKQQHLLDTIDKYPLSFVCGPAGTGKTYLAVAAAAKMLLNNDVERIILSRPAVDAGEKLGYLPGDMTQKVDPYLKPLTDSLVEILGNERYSRYIEKNIIEIAPIAFMRGRTLNNSCIILDEAQNTTKEQMKMFLTRIGHSSKMVITGDTTQIDLPHNQESGLVHACKILKSIKEIGMVTFDASDVVRHPLIGEIIKAYDKK